MLVGNVERKPRLENEPKRGKTLENPSDCLFGFSGITLTASSLAFQMRRRYSPL
jgi:hypothetical protein